MLALREATMTLDHEMRSTVRSFGYRGSKPKRVAAIFCGVAVCLDLVAANALGRLAESEGAPFYLTTLTALILFASCGPMALTISTNSEGAPCLARGLRSLPLSNQAIRLRVLSAGAVLGCACMALIAAPAFAVFRGWLGNSAPAMALTLTIVALSVATALTCATAFKAAMPLPSWRPMRHPLTMLCVLGITAVSLAAVFLPQLAAALPIRLLGMPGLLVSVANSDMPTQASLAVSLAAAATAILVSVVVSVGLAQSSTHRRLRFQWADSRSPRLLVGELLLACRNPIIGGNFAAALIMNVVCVVVVLAVTGDLAPEVATACTALLAFMAGIAPRMLRSVHAQCPKAAFAGAQPRIWIPQLTIVACILYFVAYLPALPLLLSISGSPTPVIEIAALQVGASLAAALLLAWALPLIGEQPALQILSVATYALIQGIPFIVLSLLGGTMGSTVAIFVVAAMFVLAAAAAARLEPQRWLAP